MDPMNINFSYTLIGWEDYPSTKTPVKAALLNQMDSAIQFLYTQDGYLYDLAQDLKADKVDAYLFDSYLLTATSFIELSQKVDAFDLTNYLTKDEANVFATKTDLNNYATREELDYKAELSGDVEDNEVIVGSSPDVVKGSGVKLTQLAQIIDHENAKFTLTNTETFTMLHQHIYQVGALVFVHLVFRTNAQIAETGLFTLGKLDDSILPQHVHSFTVVPSNPGVSNDIRVDPGYIDLDGTISFDVTKTYSSSNYTFDITTFYCADISTPIVTQEL